MSFGSYFTTKKQKRNFNFDSINYLTADDVYGKNPTITKLQNIDKRLDANNYLSHIAILAQSVGLDDETRAYHEKESKRLFELETKSTEYKYRHILDGNTNKPIDKPEFSECDKA